MAGVEEELWNIFTFYTLRGNPLDLTRLSVTQFLRLARDCQIVDGGRANIQRRSLAGGDFRPEQHSERRLGQAAVNLAFASVIQGRSKVISANGNNRGFTSKARMSPATTDHAAVKSKLTYPEFLDALVILGERMYRTTAERRSRSTHPGDAGSTPKGRNRRQSVESAFQQLLMENVLPLASRRRPAPISTAIRDPLVRDLLRHHGPALKEIFRFYAVSSLAASKRSPPDNSNRGSASSTAGNGKAAAQTTPDGAEERARQQQVVPGLSLESATTLPQSPNSPGKTGAPGVIQPDGGGASSNCSVLATDKSTIVADVAAAETPAGTEIANSTTTTTTITTIPTTQPPTTRTSRCPSSITWSFSQERISTSPKQRKADGALEYKTDDGLSDGEGSRKGDGGGGGGIEGTGGSGGGGTGGTSDGQGERRRPASSARSSRPTYTARGAMMNSMADSLSHQCLLYFAADFGISGALLSTLEVGEVYLSCDGGLTDLFCGEKRVGKGTPLAGFARRTGLARAGKGRIRPLTFPEFLEALVRISLACFRPTDCEQHGSCEDSVGPGQCLRALLALMWRRLRASATLALNGVREGGARHRSSIQKGALLKGVQLFNEQMLSSCRAEGFLDIPTTSPTGTSSLGGSLRHAPRQGCAAQMLRDLLALGQSHAIEGETGSESDENGLQRHRGEEEAGRGGEGKAVARSPAARCHVDSCSS